MKINFFLLSMLLCSSLVLLSNNIQKIKEVTYLNKVIYSKNIILNKSINTVDFTINNNSKIKIEYGSKYRDLGNKIKNFEEVGLVINLANLYGYDWKYFICQIYYESKFDTNATSEKNAKGLMQITRFVYSKSAEPYNGIDNVIIGITYFDYLYKLFNDIPNENERIKFTLAAYNCGIGTVQNIRNNHNNTTKYDNIVQYLPNETFNYVNNILAMYNNINVKNEVQG